MTNESKPSRKSGSNASASSVTPTTSEGGPKTVRLKSLTEGGENPGTGMFIPPMGVIFEADADRGQALVACGMAEFLKEGE